MRFEPLSKLDQAHAIQVIGQRQIWRHERSGYRISIWLDRGTLYGGHIEYSVYRERRTVRGRAKTVADAVEEINALIKRGMVSIQERQKGAA